MSNTRRATNMVVLCGVLGMAGAFLAAEGLINTSTGLLLGLAGSGFGAMLALHVRAMGWDIDE